MGKRRVVAETGAGQHGVATATVCALLGLECVVYMGSEDMARQAPNVQRMRLLGAEVRAVDSGARTLKDAINEAMRDWVTNVRTTHYLLGSVLGAHPYPMMVRDFHAVIGEEARGQILRRGQARLPDVLVACVGGGSNAIGLFAAFLDDPVRAGRRRGRRPRRRRRASTRRASWASRRAPRSASCTARARTCCRTRPATCCPRTRSRPASTTRRSGPSTRCCTTSGASATTRVRDAEALDAFRLLARDRGHPARARVRARGRLGRRASGRRCRTARSLVNLSGRGDKDLATFGDGA